MKSECSIEIMKNNIVYIKPQCPSPVQQLCNEEYERKSDEHYFVW